MIKTIIKFCKEDKIEEVRRFICEDLQIAHKFLGLFDELKRKKIFRIL
jgi:hypothetical protein